MDMARENTTESKRYDQKVSEGAERMARRMGVHFVQDGRWEDVVRASQQHRRAG
jgi:hypothetical protein